MATVFLALGANLGDRMANLRDAVRRIAAQAAIAQISPVYETEPWGIIEQPAFLNLALQANTQLAPFALLEFVKAIERDMGRTSTVRYGPRLIDIDILFYDELILTSYTLTIPHPRIAERAFVLTPLADIAPDLIHPLWQLSAREMSARVDSSGVHRRAAFTNR